MLSNHADRRPLNRKTNFEISTRKGRNAGRLTDSADLEGRPKPLRAAAGGCASLRGGYGARPRGERESCWRRRRSFSVFGRDKPVQPKLALLWLGTPSGSGASSGRWQ